MSVFTKRLKEARNKIGLSQKQLGIEAGLDPSVASPRMNQYEKGTHLPDGNTAKKICDALGVPVAFLYCEDDDLARVVESFHNLSDEQRKRILTVVDL
ncbi:helix-turn-helix domain-containing protein [Marinomonas balearica]|uniref:helix-turn-helix domain-containing protein n=1 Tax=Marinomonas balearica TaxID=491947 RepID=UPI00105C47F7